MEKWILIYDFDVWLISNNSPPGNQAVVEDSEIDENKNVKPCDRENAAARRQPNGTQKTIGKRTATDEGKASKSDSSIFPDEVYKLNR
jgi:hypothetical protein